MNSKNIKKKKMNLKKAGMNYQIGKMNAMRHFKIQDTIIFKSYARDMYVCSTK